MRRHTMPGRPATLLKHVLNGLPCEVKTDGIGRRILRKTVTHFACVSYVADSRVHRSKGLIASTALAEIGVAQRQARMNDITRILLPLCRVEKRARHCGYVNTQLRCVSTRLDVRIII